MDAILKTEDFLQNWFYSVGEVIEKEFVKPIDKVNAKIIFGRIRNKDIDVKKILGSTKKLPEEQWTSKIVLHFLKEFHSEIGISDNFIQKNSIQKLTSQDLQEVKWELIKRIIVDYAKFSKELYDNLKYSANPNISFDKKRLMYDLMRALDQIYEASKDLMLRYESKLYNKNSFRKFVHSKYAIDHLLLRIYFILLNIENEAKLRLYGKTLSTEVAEFTLAYRR